ncbi:hypothetical protein FF38_09436 [Lucilia cuprina]|uniref:Uncharacterized protein n=1 Tax=Lucilia cuprina TaxID=7375 RepID=A0A0L0C8X7_LUCCU|nr:hypothetical protein FF38_09436 [Lucilia cuprina]
MLGVDNDKPLELETVAYSAHDCATVFKGYLVDLSEPLLTEYPEMHNTKVSK